MPNVPIVFGTTTVELKPAPINPEWIKAGAPFARNAHLYSSDDRTSYTLIWDCTPGQFEWHYDIDETIHILHGSVVLDDGHSMPRRCGAGDVVLFRKGAVVHWTVETHVRKLAFFRRPLPLPIAIMSRALTKARGRLQRKLVSPASMTAASASFGVCISADTQEG